MIIKNIKKFILLSLVIALPMQAIEMPSWGSLSGGLRQFYSYVGKVFQKQKKVVAIALTAAGCTATVFGWIYKKRKEAKERAGREKRELELRQRELELCQREEARAEQKRHEAAERKRTEERAEREKREEEAAAEKAEQEKEAEKKGHVEGNLSGSFYAVDRGELPSPEDVSSYLYNKAYYIKNGYKIIATLLDGRQTEAQRKIGATKENKSTEEALERIRIDYLNEIISVILVFHKFAEDDGNNFGRGAQGAFNIDCKEITDFVLGYINFFENGAFAYRRPSSHLIDLSEKYGMDQYGVDFRFSKDQYSRPMAEEDKRHLLVIPMPSLDAKPSLDANGGKINLKNYHRCLIKPENYGFYDYWDTVCHLGGWGRSGGQRIGLLPSHDEIDHKERVPKELLREFEGLLDETFYENEKTRAQHKHDANMWGIQSMLKTAVELGHNRKFSEFANELRKYKHPELRFGREVIYTRKDLAKRLFQAE